jgi:hypothetical protein
METALEPVKFLEGIGEGGFDLGCGLAVQPLWLD